MKKLEKQALLNWASQLSDQELVREYNRLLNKLLDAILDAIEDHYYFGKTYSQELEERVSILSKIATERGINLWEN